MKKVISVAILIVSVLVSCKIKHDPVKYAEDKDNGLKKEITIGEVHYTIQYKPADYIVAMEHLDAEAEAERLKQLKGTVWFNISFSIIGFNQSPLRYKIAGVDEYTERQDYFLNEASKDIYLMYGTDTVYVDSYWFENNQNITPYETMIVGFVLPDGDETVKKDMRLSFHDRVYRNGVIKTVIRKEDIN